MRVPFAFLVLAGTIPFLDAQLAAQLPPDRGPERARDGSMFHARNGKPRPGRIGAAMPRPSRHLAGGSLLVPQAVALETELNDTNARPDSMVGQADYDGKLSVPADRDFVRFDLAQDSLVSLTVNANGGTPTPDPHLILLDAHGQYIAFDDDSFGFYPWIGLPLPAGSYRAVVGTFAANGAGDYRLSLATQPATIPTLVPNQLANDSFNTANGGINTYRIVLAAASAVSIAVNSATLDTNVGLCRGLGGEFAFNDDSSASTNARIETHLKAGTYFVLASNAGYQSGPFSILLSTTPAEPTLGCSGSASGNLAGDQSQPMWKTTLASAQDAIWVTSAGSAPSVSDTAMRLFDAEYGLIAFNDDSAPSPYARIGGSLPAGTYYVMVVSGLATPGRSGNFNLGLNCAASSARNGDFGQNLLPLPSSGEGGTLTVSIGTPSPLDVRIAPSPGGFSMVAILDDAGRSLGWDTDAGFSPTLAVGADVGMGRYHILIRDLVNRAVTADASIRPQIYFRNRVTDRTLVVEDKVGRQMHLFAAAALLPGPLMLSPPIQGNLLIDLNLHVYLGAQTVPIAGIVTWPLGFQPYPVALQGVTVSPSPFELAMTQAVR
jgi:hypothetical protein